ncbi:arylesterase [Jannaschia sp. Os4]|uniref:arylesterase n=1 Tax=Jannaschia sp. Os4 TaxID=2807617 RepID=UPI001939F593|nr:arylesterase [Jannaschia sp. Os4]MBM2577814.1 arylesterase [Jannaschia sp. Os4]
MESSEPFGSVAYGTVARGLKVAAVALGLFAAPAAAQEVTIAALGDSLTAGYGLPEEDGFVPALNRWLDAAGVAAEVTNAGVSGDTTAGGLARLDWTLTPEVDAVIVALGGNDLLRGVDPAVSRANLDGILEALAARGVPALVIGMEASGNYGAAYKAAFDAMYPELAEEHGALLAPSFLGPLVAEVDIGTARVRYMQGDGIHPNAEGVEVIVEAIGPRVAELAAVAEPES